MNALLAALRQRKVVQWGVAYAAGAWGLLQGLEYASSTFDWPRQFQQLATIALLIGLPIALVLAWYHGDRGEQRIRRTEFAIVTLLFLLGGGLFWRYQSTTEKSPATTTEAAAPVAAAAPADARPSIAVLPFENRSDQSKDAFFVDGIHDDILTQLTKVSALKVISRTSVEQFRGTKLPMKNIADQLGVKSILEGGVQRAGDRVRINVQLIDAATDAHLWAESYDRELTAANIFAIQSEVAAAIAAALKAALTPAERTRANAVPTQKLAAWESYQLGNQRMAKRTSKALTEAEGFFEKAIDIDPNFAMAHAGLAYALLLQTMYSDVPRSATLARAEAVASRALELDPMLAEGHSAAAGVANERQDFPTAEREFRRAIELNPNYSTAYHFYGYMLTNLGRNAEALRLFERAVQLDPLSAQINVNLGDVLVALGRFDEALTRYRRAMEIDPAMPGPYNRIGAVQAYALNRFAAAIPSLEQAVARDPKSSMWSTELGLAYLQMGDDAQAGRYAARAIELGAQDYLANCLQAELLLYRGESAASLRYAKRAWEISPRVTWLGSSLVRNADLLAGKPNAARARYAKTFPELLAAPAPKVHGANYGPAIDLSLVLQRTGEAVRAGELLARSQDYIRTVARLGLFGYGIADVQIYALQGQKSAALVALRQAERDGWRLGWRYFRDFDPNLASIRNEPEFKAVFADIERDMARQRAELAARPKNAPLDLGSLH
jgi:TolB-like protein/Tfp pilus assembly protein PilF